MSLWVLWQPDLPVCDSVVVLYMCSMCVDDPVLHRRTGVGCEIKYWGWAALRYLRGHLPRIHHHVRVRIERDCDRMWIYGVNGVNSVIGGMTWRARGGTG
jgi:hypothetical protein